MSYVRMALVLSVCVLPAVAGAVDVSLLVGYQISSDFEATPIPDDGTQQDISVDETPVWALALDFPFQGQFDERFGFYLSHQRTAFSSRVELDSRDLEITHLHFTAQILRPNGRWEPYLLGGLGAAHFSPDDASLSSKTFVSAQLAGGVGFRLADKLLLRGGLRWIPTFFNGSGAIFCSGGCTVGVSSSIWNQGAAELGLQFRF